MERKQFDDQIKALPTRPGVYLMKDGLGNIIYVGKAVNLRNRVRSYFGSQSGHTPKVKRMVARIDSFEIIITDSELEALILECNLIKKHRPHYNVLMKDDKHYPYLKIDIQQEWAQIYITRRIEQDGAKYFGPYTDSRSVRRTLELLKRLFPYRACNKNITGTETRTCLNYHIKRCLGPCIGGVDKNEYAQVIKQVVLFLEGKQETIAKDLRKKMDEASDRLEYERAAIFRDQLLAVEKVTERQKIVSDSLLDKDVIAFARDNGEACVQVFFIRAGKLIGREHFILEGTAEENSEEIMGSFVKQFYDAAAYVPSEVLVQNELDEMVIIESWLRNKRGAKVALQVPKRGEKKKLVEMVAENAHQTLEQLKVKWLSDANKASAATLELQQQLGLTSPPHRIECYDISNIQGTSAVGSMVVFEGGKARNSEYRRFKIKTVEGANDYAMLQEVFSRRFRRGKEARIAESYVGEIKDDENDANSGAARNARGWSALPDLVVVDGGKGQLSSVLETMRDLGTDWIPVIGLAKENEEIYAPQMAEPIRLPRNSQALHILQRIRDEAHRFALAYHTKVRSRATFTSAIDEVPGIGPKRKQALIKKFGTVKAIREAPIDEIAGVIGMTRAMAERLKERL